VETHALFAAGVLEKSYGSLYYLQTSFLLIVSCGVVVMALYWIAITIFRREHYAKQNAIGYSCVVFGLMTIAAMKPGTIYSEEDKIRRCQLSWFCHDIA